MLDRKQDSACGEGARTHLVWLWGVPGALPKCRYTSRPLRGPGDRRKGLSSALQLSSQALNPHRGEENLGHTPDHQLTPTPTEATKHHLPESRTVPRPLGEARASWSKVRILPPALRMRLRARLLTRRAQTWGRQAGGVNTYHPGYLQGLTTNSNQVHSSSLPDHRPVGQDVQKLLLTKWQRNPDLTLAGWLDSRHFQQDLERALENHPCPTPRAPHSPKIHLDR